MFKTTVYLRMAIAMALLVSALIPRNIVRAAERTPTFGPSGGSATAAELVTAMNIPANLIISASLGSSSMEGTHVFSGLGGFPTNGSSFAVISSGNAANADRPNSEPNLSTTLSGQNNTQGNDIVQLYLTLRVPPGANFWSVDWKMFSEEYPEYVGSIYNDVFLIETPSSSIQINSDSTVFSPYNVAYDANGELISINTTGALGMTSSNATGTTYDGATATLVTVAPIPSGATEISLVFSVSDLGDSVFDTTVFLDNFKFHQVLPESYWEDVLDNMFEKVIAGKMIVGGKLYDLLVLIDPWSALLDLVQIGKACAVLWIEPSPAGEIGCAAALITAIVTNKVVDGAQDLFKWMSEDPPDFNYTEAAVLEVVEPVSPYDENSSESLAWAALINKLSEQNAIITALMTSIERLQGAAISGEPEYMLLQAQGVEQYWNMLLDNQIQLSVALNTLAGEFEAANTPMEEDIYNQMQEIIAGGFSSEWIDLFHDLGFTEEEIHVLTNIPTKVTPSEDLVNPVKNGLLEWASLIDQEIIPVLSEGSTETSALIDFLESSLEESPTNQSPLFDTPPSPITGTEFYVNEGESISFVVQASDPDPEDMVGINDLAFPDGATFTPSVGNPSLGEFNWTPTSDQEGVHNVVFSAVDNHLSTSAPLQVVIVVQGEVNQPPSLTVPGELSLQYSDVLSSEVLATDPDNSGSSLVFSAIGLPSGLILIDNGDGTAALTGTATASPATYTALITVTDPGGLSDSKPANIVVTQEDAVTTYTGPMLVSTNSVNSSTVVVPLRATIRDITAFDPVADSDPGDITNATVSFVNRGNNAVLCTANVVLLNPADQKVGSAACDWNVNIGSSSGVDYTIGIVVDGYYTRNSPADDSVVVVSKPVSNFITGGGYFINESSGGAYAGDPDAKTNFGLTIKFNNRLTNLQGRATIIVRQGERVYQIKTNALNSLVTVPYNPLQPRTGTAELIGKANVTDVTDPLNPVAVAGNATLNVVMKDNGEPGSVDLISFSLWSRNGTLLFSSNWDGVRTVPQLLNGGNLNIK